MIVESIHEEEKNTSTSRSMEGDSRGACADPPPFHGRVTRLIDDTYSVETFCTYR